MINIVYLTVGEKAIVKESFMSIKSFFTVAEKELIDQTRIIIYTDIPEMYENLFKKNTGIILEIVDEKQLLEWIGPQGYIYRLKMMILLHCIEKYKCPLLFVDSDTMFVTSPKDLLKRLQDPNLVILHYIENQLEEKATFVEKYSRNPMTKKFFKEMMDNGYLNDRTYRYEVKPDMDQWNSGVIGLHQNNTYLLEKAVILTDYIYKEFEIRVAEQFALSCVFQHEKEICSADSTIFHYWFFKECRYMLENFYGHSKYDYPLKFVNENVVAQIKLIKNWNVSFEEVFLMIVCVMRKKWEKDWTLLKIDITTEGFLKTVMFSEEYYKNAVFKVGEYC